MSYKDNLVNHTVDLLVDHGIVPIDTIFKLTSLGVNYSILEDTYSILN